jgi:hypothetical protein
MANRYNQHDSSLDQIVSGNEEEIYGKKQVSYRQVDEASLLTMPETSARTSEAPRHVPNYYAGPRTGSRGHMTDQIRRLENKLEKN